MALVVLDNDESGTKRKLPQNEVLAMALNEVAFVQGEGFFFYLRTRDAKHSDDRVLLPDSRRAHAPGFAYPSQSRVKIALTYLGRSIQQSHIRRSSRTTTSDGLSLMRPTAAVTSNAVQSSIPRAPKLRCTVSNTSATPVLSSTTHRTLPRLYYLLPKIFTLHLRMT